MADQIIEFIKSVFSPVIGTLIISFLPGTELRGGIPFGVLMGMPLSKAVIFSILGNLAPIIPLVFLLEKGFKQLCKTRMGDKFVCWVYKRAEAKSASIGAYKTLGVMIFVGVPLPGTGAWTGAVVGQLIGLTRIQQIIALTGGVLIAAAIVGTLMYLGIESWMFIKK